MNPTTQPSFINWINESETRKNMAQTILVLIAIVLATKAVLLFRQATHIGVADNMPQSIQVNGHAEEYVAPDTLMFTVSVTEEGKDVAEATAKAAEKINKAISSLKANGVDEKNIKTTYYNVSDKYQNVSSPCPVSAVAPAGKYMEIAMPPCSNVSSSVIGSILNQSLEVRIRDIDKNATAEKRAKIVSDLAAAGVKVDSFTFTIFDTDAARAAVREKAIDKAKADAKKLERELGVDLGPIAGFSENAGGYNPYMSARSENASASMDKAAAPQLPAGEQRVSVDVSLTYLLK